MSILLQDHRDLMRFERWTEHLPIVGKLFGPLSEFQMVVGSVMLVLGGAFFLVAWHAGVPGLWSVAPPAALVVVTTIKAGQSLPDGRSPKEWLWAHLWYWLEPRHSYNFQPVGEPIGQVRFRVTLWRKPLTQGARALRALPEHRPGPVGGNGHPGTYAVDREMALEAARGAYAALRQQALEAARATYGEGG